MDSRLRGNEEEPRLNFNPYSTNWSTYMKLWRCTVCGYEVMAEEPPDICPSCGAPKEAFVEVEDE